MITDEPLHDFEDELKPASNAAQEDVDEPEAEWSGSASKVGLAPGANVFRDFVFVTAGSECVDCKRKGRSDRTHQFHVRASKVGRRWVGPEGPHVEDLRAQGFLRGTPESQERAKALADVAYLRGVEKESRCRHWACGEAIGRDESGALLDLCPNGHRNGIEELRPLTLAQLRKLWRNASNFETAHQLEKGQIRDEVAALREAVKGGFAEGMQPLTDIVKEALAELIPQKKAK